MVNRQTLIWIVRRTQETNVNPFKRWLRQAGDNGQASPKSSVLFRRFPTTVKPPVKLLFVAGHHGVRQERGPSGEA